MSQEALLQELEETHERLQIALLAKLERQNQRLRLRLLERENVQLRAKVHQPPQRPATVHSVSPVGHSADFSLCRYDDLVRVRPGLKAVFAPKINGACRTMAQILADGRKAQAARERAFCKPKGINSVLGDYTSGRTVRYGYPVKEDLVQVYETIETFRMKKVKGEYVSEGRKLEVGEILIEL